MLEDFLIQPLQRLCKYERHLNEPHSLPLQPRANLVVRSCRYPLLFESLLNKTPESHPDRENLVLALAEIRRVVNLVNERARTVENVERLNEIQARFEDAKEFDLVQQNRFLVKESEVDMFKHNKVQSRLVRSLAASVSLTHLYPCLHAGHLSSRYHDHDAIQ